MPPATLFVDPYPVVGNDFGAFLHGAIRRAGVAVGVGRKQLSRRAAFARCVHPFRALAGNVGLRPHRAAAVDVGEAVVASARRRARHAVVAVTGDHVHRINGLAVVCAVTGGFLRPDLAVVVDDAITRLQRGVRRTRRALGAGRAQFGCGEDLARLVHPTPAFGIGDVSRDPAHAICIDPCRTDVVGVRNRWARHAVVAVAGDVENRIDGGAGGLDRVVAVVFVAPVVTVLIGENVAVFVCRCGRARVARVTRWSAGLCGASSFDVAGYLVDRRHRLGAADLHPFLAVVDPRPVVDVDARAGPRGRSFGAEFLRRDRCGWCVLGGDRRFRSCCLRNRRVGSDERFDEALVRELRRLFRLG